MGHGFNVDGKMFVADSLVRVGDSLIMDAEEKFAGLKVETLVSGAPFISGGLSFFDCRILQSILLGTNTLFIGEILDLRSVDDGDPLLYFDQKYQKFG